MITSQTVIEEIRQSRRRMSEQSGHDPAKYIEYLKTFNTKYSSQVEKYRKEPCPPSVKAARGVRA